MHIWRSSTWISLFFILTPALSSCGPDSIPADTLGGTTAIPAGWVEISGELTSDATGASSSDAFSEKTSSQACDGSKVEICHNASKEPANAQTLCVSQNAVPAHEGHGDLLCACGKVGKFYHDADGDGYGGGTPVQACSAPAGTITRGGDCNDANGAINPMATEVCDGQDNDCNGQLDETDEDGDGFSPCDLELTDCDDFRATVHPGGVELCNGLDEDCNGVVDDDFDQDGDGVSSCQGDCRDDDPAKYPVLSDGWVESPCSPVLPNSSGLDPLYTDQASLLLDPTSISARYKAWYRLGSDVNTRIGYAVSADGVHFVKQGEVLGLGAAGGFDANRLVYPTVLFRDGLYRMWYAGYNDTTASFAIGHATSPDGMTWTRVDGNPATSSIDPVLAPAVSGFDSRSAQAPSVLWRPEANAYFMWYGATDKANNALIQVALATSPDGVTWTKQGVVLPVAAGAWDSQRVNFPRVIDNGEGLEMWYAGMASTGLSWRVGYATSPDGVRWSRTPINPVVSGVGGSTAWNGYMVYSPSTLIQLDAADREVYSMYVSGGATSSGTFQTGLMTNTAPFVTITAPFAGTAFRTTDNVPLEVYVDEPYAVERVTVRVMSGNVELASGHPDARGYAHLPVRLAAGSQTLTVVVEDSGALRGSDSLPVTVSP